MKKSCTFFSLLFILLFSVNNVSFAQCPGCVLNTSCVITPAYPTTCPYDTLPNGTAGQAYDNDITFYMPEIFEVTSPITQNVHLDELVINNVTGLPSGLNWQTNSTNNTYHPSAGNEHGCAKVCGTPLFPGVYNVTIFFQVTVTPQSIGGVTTQNESSTMTLIINQNPSGNSAFVTSNPQGCAPLTSDFNPVVTSGGSPLYSYSWDFGNGNTSTSENPSTQTYLNAGTYVVSQTTNMLAYRLTDVTFDAGSNTNWCGDIDEPDVFGCTGSPDLVFELRDNTSSIIYTSSEVSNSMTGSWNSINLQLQNQTYTIQFWDIDAVSANDNLGIFTITPGAVGTFNFSGGGVSGTYTIDTEIINSISDTDSIKVFPVPSVLTITSAPNDSACSDQTITLTVPGGYYYQWYNDTALLYNAIDTFITLSNTSGDYWVMASNQYGCSSASQHTAINFIENPPKPTFGIASNTLTCYLTDVTFQWYQNGVLINGATNNTYTITASDYYSLVVTNSFGCYNNSDTVFVTKVGISENIFVNDFSLFPNPNNGEFTVSFGMVTIANVKITITDLIGKVVYQKDEGEQNGKIERFVNLSELNKGMYLFNLQAGKVQINKRIIIQ